MNESDAAADGKLPQIKQQETSNSLPIGIKGNDHIRYCYQRIIVRRLNIWGSSTFALVYIVRRWAEPVKAKI